MEIKKPDWLPDDAILIPDVGWTYIVTDYIPKPPRKTTRQLLEEILEKVKDK